MSSVPSGWTGGNSEADAHREQRSFDLHDRPANLIARINGELHELNPHDLENDEAVQVVRNDFRRADATVNFILSELLRWDHSARWTVLQFIAGTNCPYVLRTSSEGQDFSNLLDAILELMEGDRDAERCERGRRAAVEAAAFVHRGELRIACSRILRRLQQLGVRGGYRVEALLQEARTALRAIQGQNGQEEDASYLVDIINDAPVPEDVVVPRGWFFSETGISSTGSDAEDPVLTCPLVIAQRLVDVAEGTEWVELCWFRDRRWRRQIVPRTQIATARTLVELSDYGLPVNGHNAKGVVRYLADFENTNIEMLPREQVTKQLGWQGTSERSFLWGRQLITADEAATPPATRVSNITFRGSDDGEEQLVDGFHAAGSFDTWMENVQVLAQFPRVRLAVFAALSTVLIAVFDTFNYVLSFSGPTSQGKTTALRATASCWGCPDERSPRAVISTWDSTRVWIERAAAVQSDHALIIDDTKRARRVEDISQTIYDVTSGRGRGRGSVDGMRSTGTFHTVLISSGEANITSFTRDGGTRARVLEFWGSPFGAATTETGMVVTSLNEGVLENYGHAGPRFTQYVVNHQGQWTAWRERYRELRRQYVERADGNSVAMRMAAHFAVLDLTVQLAAEAGCVPWPADDVIASLWPELIAETGEADQAAVALRYVWSWVAANEGTFHGRRSGSQHPPQGGWAGRWRSGQDWDFVAFYEPRIEHVLREYGFEPEPILRTWRDRGWLRVSPHRRLYRCRVDGRSSEDLVAIERQAIDELLGADEEPPNSESR